MKPLNQSECLLIKYSFFGGSQTGRSGAVQIEKSAPLVENDSFLMQYAAKMKTSDYIGIALTTGFGLWWLLFPRLVIRF
ncbi:MAG TPA: hypothetical protein VG733_18080, partial [Chthoniobacteraceae bacterium]|nr:hypothetical protein [Chthoniobacteraceae bacterium]